MLAYFPFFHISPHFSFSKLFGSPLFQRHVPADVPLTQAMLPLNQYHVWDPSTLSKPMNQRVFLRFLVKFLTKCHSNSVSIETSEPFPWRLHLSLAVLQSTFSSWKEYLEQTVPDFYGKPIDKREERQARKIFLFTYLWILLYHLRIRKSYTQKENWIKPSDTHESFYICYGAVRIGWKKLWISKIISLHKSKMRLRGGIHLPFPFNPTFNEIEVKLNSVSALLQRIQIQ